jgi:hypothetical protein
MTFTTIAIITLAIVLAVAVWRLHRAERRIELLRERLHEVEERVAPGAGTGVGPAGAGGPGGVRW